MKLLFDENLSDRILPQVMDLYPGSQHVKEVGLTETDDQFLWNYAASHGLAIVSKDSDFRQKSLLFGHPPKLVFLKIGNCATSEIVQLLRIRYPLIAAFDSDPVSSILILP